MRIKMVAVGFEGAGKTCLFFAHVKMEFPQVYVPLVFESYILDITDSIQLHLFDSMGSKDFEKLRPLSYVHANVFILCFDVTKKDLSAELESYWYSELRHHCPDVPIILTATKIDLRETEKNCVNTEEGEALAAKTRSHYAEISSLKGIGLDELFENVVNVGREHFMVAKRSIRPKCTFL